MNAEPAIRVSVLVPVYGVERFMADCARSLFAQSVGEGVEFIFVDDASTDGSIAALEGVLAEFPERQPQVSILRHAGNRGLAAARRTAIDAARGEWLLHADSDDMLLPGALEALLAEADAHPTADLIYGDYLVAAHPEAADPHAQRIRMPRWDRKRLLHAMLSQTFRVDNRTWGILIRRTLCTEYGIYPVEGINFAEDYAVMPRLLYAARAVAMIPQAVYAYREARDGSYMKRLDDRAAAQFVAANGVVERCLRAQADYDRWRDSVILGRLGIEKWMLLRGLRPADYDAALFADGDRPRRFDQRLFAAAIRTGIVPLVRLIGAWFRITA